MSLSASAVCLLSCIAVMVVLGATGAAAQTATPIAGAEEYKVYTEHPRLLLNQKRLRLLRRERERQSLRWTQLEALMKGRAAMPEPAFAWALYAQVAGDPAACATAVAAAARPSTAIRQVALTYDWCQDQEAALPPLRARLERSLRDPVSSFEQARDHAFAAIVLSDAAALSTVVQGWWRGQMAPALRSGDKAIEHSDIYPFMELAHAVRDNVLVDLRDDILAVFRDLALRRVLSYYPATWPSPENDFRIPSYSGKGDPDLRLASLTRAGEFALVAFESNAQEMQFLQGWLLLDRFVLKGAFGAPYEFLWANPYQPGLPFAKLPLSLHDSRTGALFLRSSWDEDATWIGITGGQPPQLFRDGQLRTAPLRDPVQVGDAMILPGTPNEREFRVAGSAPEIWYLTGLRPSSNFDVEVDDEEMTDASSDRNGILTLQFQRRAGQVVYLHPPRTAKTETPR